MPILAGIQARNQVIGAIRCGDKEEYEPEKFRPRGLGNFRLTTHDKIVAAEAAGLYGGEPRPWRKQWEVYTETSSIDVALPPGHLVIDQSMTRWSKGGLLLKCDGVTVTRPERGPCQCPQPADPDDPESVWAAISERRRRAHLKPPRGCLPNTTLRVVLPDISGGAAVWVLRSSSEQAAAEIVGQALIMERYRAAGTFLPARVVIEQRETPVAGINREFVVPVIVLPPIRRLAELAETDPADQPLTAQLRAGGEPRAITAAPPPAGDAAIAVTARSLAARALAATTESELEALRPLAETGDLWDDDVWVPEDPADPDSPQVEMTLREAMNRRWSQIRAGRA